MTLLAFCFAVLPILGPAAPAAAAEGRSTILFAPEFRGFVGPGGSITADRNQWDVGPAEGEAAFYNGLGLRLTDAPSDVILSKRLGGSYHDQYGGEWTVQRLKVMFRDPDEVCDEAFSEQRSGYHCYFLTPRFGGYATAGGGRITGTLSTALAHSITQTTHDQAEADLKKMRAEGILDPVEQLRTPMFQRLCKAMLGHVDRAAASRGALRPQDFPDFEIAGRTGAWEVRFFNNHDGQGPKEPLGVVPGAALEAAHFGLSEKYRSIIDTGHSGIQGIDLLGLDPYVVKRAFEEAYKAAKTEADQKNALSIGEKLGRLLGR